MFKVNDKDTKWQLLAYFTPCSSVSIVNFELVIVGWAGSEMSRSKSRHLIAQIVLSHEKIKKESSQMYWTYRLGFMALVILITFSIRHTLSV